MSAAEPDVFAAEHRIPWGALAPYAPLTDFDDEAPESEAEVESTDYFPVTLAGHEWISDRYMLIRTELLSGEPMSSQYPSTWPAEGVTGALQKVLDQAQAAGNPQALNPYYVLLAERAGWTLEPAERLWRIVLDGAIVGAIVGLRDGADGGRRPGDDLTRIREVVKYLPGHNPQAYIAAARIVDALDALDDVAQGPAPVPLA